MVFIRLFESWAGLLGFAWAALFVPWEEVEEGKNRRAEEIQTCLINYLLTFLGGSSTFKRNLPLSTFCRPQVKICWIFFLVLISDSWPEEVCCQPLICQASIGTNHTDNPTFSSKTWLLGSCKTPSMWPGWGRYKHALGSGEYTHKNKTSSVAKGCAKYRNWRMMDCQRSFTI